MTYNVHGLTGMDGVVSSDRIARVIATFRPHVIALQECWSFGDRGQLREICDLLVEQFRYPDTLDAFHDAYGNFIL
jgi:endonuclease/exonuclease/phosphatase family metal-dependent hydrolase